MTDSILFEAAGMTGPATLMLAIVLATFVSEDLTCISVGLLLAADRIDYLPALGGCLIGIVTGDFGVWLLGRLGGRRIFGWRVTRRILSEHRLAELSRVLCERGAQAAVVSRFLPGSRVPLFLAAGVLGTCPYRFLGWAFVAALVWVPLLVLSVAWAGDSLQEVNWLLLPAVGLTLFLLLKFMPRLFSQRGRQRLSASLGTIWHWEFWPAWLFYLPLIPWLGWLSLRYRGITVLTAANPSFPAGGVVGESKRKILSQLPSAWTVPSALIPSGAIHERLACLQHTLHDLNWSYPLVLKPDAGQRGAGVKRVHDLTDVEKYFHSNPDPILAQPFHPGPYEAGLFYIRDPEESQGRLFSITDKIFPEVTGNGHSTLEDLIWAHPRYRYQARTFLERHHMDANHVPAAGERVPLAMAGNHCQGTLFRDGEFLHTPELAARIDEIARQLPGFYFGRFDVRYASVAELRAGHGFAILELNGVTSESTNLYDPAGSLWRAYRILFRQWSILYQIGAANRRRGVQSMSLHELVSLVWTYYRARTVSLLSD